MKSLFLQNEEGQIDPVYSISAGLDYPGIGPEHAHLHEIGRAEYVSITDEQAVKAFEYLSKTEGVIPAIESSHAVAAAMEIVPTMSKDQSVVICLSGRGDKDVYQVARYRGVQLDRKLERHLRIEKEWAKSISNLHRIWRLWVRNNKRKISELW